MSEERRFTNQNLAGLLSEALGLESGAGRSSFSGPSRETFGRALEQSPSPRTFGELLRVLEDQGSGDRSAVEAVRAKAEEDPSLSLQAFAESYVERGSAS